MPVPENLHREGVGRQGHMLEVLVIVPITWNTHTVYVSDPTRKAQQPAEVPEAWPEPIKGFGNQHDRDGSGTLSR
jgi:hypothetical protein